MESRRVYESTATRMMIGDGEKKLSMRDCDTFISQGRGSVAGRDSW